MVPHGEINSVSLGQVLFSQAGFVKEHGKLPSAWDSALHLEKERINNLDRMHEY